MTRLQIRLVSLALFALLCATATYWVVTFTSRPPLALDAASVAHTPVTVEAAGALFGGAPGERNRDIRVSGILTLGPGRGAAAILSVGDGRSRAFAAGAQINKDVTLSEVRARSIIVDRHGAHSEIFLPAPGTGATIYVR